MSSSNILGDENHIMGGDMGDNINSSTASNIIFVAFIFSSAVIFGLIYRTSTFRSKANRKVLAGDDSLTKSSILEQVNKKERMLLQSRVANARTARHLFSIFDEFEVLHKLKLPASIVSADHVDMKDQIFRDLVREKININDTPVKFDDTIYSHVKQFKQLFVQRVEQEIAHHVSSKKERHRLALYICCHLCRTRAGGDSLFAVRDIFDTPQVKKK